MLKRNRKIIFGVVCLTFLVTAPLLVIISLGYNLNSGKIQNSLQIKVETYPISAKVYLNNQILDTNSPTDIAITKPGESRVDITKDGYLDESYWVNPRPNQNLNTRLTQLKLLQEKGRKITKQKLSQKSLSIVDNNLIWVESKNQISKFLIQKFNVDQLNGQPIEIQEINKVKTINNLKSELKWQIVGENTFFDKDNQLVIFLSRDNWKIFSLESSLNSESLPINSIIKEVEQVVNISQDLILIKSRGGNLWELNLQDTKNPKIKLTDQGIDYLYYNIKSKNSWYLINQKLYKINGNQYNSQSNTLYLESSKLVTTSGKKPSYLNISNFVQGVVIQVDNNLYYYNDSAPNNLSLISQNTVNFTIFEDTLFWVNTKIQSGLPIYSWNFNTNYQSRLGYLPADRDLSIQDLTLDYSSKWSRLVLFEVARISSVWYDKSSVNHNITGYSLVKWIDNNCTGRIIAQNIFCLRGSENGQSQLEVFENNSLF